MIVLDQNLILFLRPLILICDYMSFCATLTISFVITLDAKHSLLIAKDNILIVGAVEQAIPLPVRLFVNEARSCDAKRVIIQDLILNILRLKAEHRLQEKHWIVLLQSHKFSDNRDDNRLQLLEGNLHFALAKRISANIFEDTFHEGICAGVFL